MWNLHLQYYPLNLLINISYPSCLVMCCQAFAPYTSYLTKFLLTWFPAFKEIPQQADGFVDYTVVGGDIATTVDGHQLLPHLMYTADQADPPTCTLMLTLPLLRKPRRRITYPLVLCTITIEQQKRWTMVSKHLPFKRSGV